MRLAAIFTSALLLTITSTSQADDNFWIGAKAGTLGIGAEATWRPLPYVDFRAGINSFSYEFDSTEAGVDYDADLDLQSFYGTANFRFPFSPFRLTTGVYSNGNEMSLESRPTSTFEIGGNTYAAGQVGQLTGNVDFESFAPYLGIGFDFRVFNTVGLSLDFGALYQDTPRPSLLASGPIALDQGFQNDLALELAELEDDLDSFKLYPVISLGMSFNF